MYWDLLEVKLALFARFEDGISGEVRFNPSI